VLIDRLTGAENLSPLLLPQIGRLQPPQAVALEKEQIAFTEQALGTAALERYGREFAGRRGRVVQGRVRCGGARARRPAENHRHTGRRLKPDDPGEDRAVRRRLRRRGTLGWFGDSKAAQAFAHRPERRFGEGFRMVRSEIERRSQQLLPVQQSFL
jgi:hypothetical protein